MEKLILKLKSSLGQERGLHFTSRHSLLTQRLLSYLASLLTAPLPVWESGFVYIIGATFKNDQEQQRVEFHEFAYLATLPPASPPCLAAPGFPTGSGVPGEKDGHVVMGRIEVTLGIDALLPLTEAGQCLLCMVHYFQSLLEKKKERSARMSLLWSAPITFVPGSSQVR